MITIDDNPDLDADMVVLVEDAVAALNDVYDPAGVVIFWSSRIKYLDGRRPCDIYRDSDYDRMRTLVQHVTALADGAFA